MKEFYKVTVDNKEHDVLVESKPVKVFDYKEYEKTLENVLEQAQKEFWSICIDFNRHQIIVGRNSLWVAAALLAAYGGMFNKFGDSIDSMSWVGGTFLISCFLSILAFGTCLYGIPSRKGYTMSYKNGWGDYSYEAYQRLEAATDNANVAYLTKSIKELDIANKENKSTNTRRAKIFRITSWLLISSFCMSLLAGVIFLLTASDETFCNQFPQNTKNYVRCIMSEENASNTNKPNVPVPEKPVSTDGPQFFLDSADPVIPPSAQILNEKSDD
jgi:hypothetical protein